MTRAEEVIAEAVDSARGQIVAEVLALHAPFKIYPHHLLHPTHDEGDAA